METIDLVKLNAFLYNVSLHKECRKRGSNYYDNPKVCLDAILQKFDYYNIERILVELEHQLLENEELHG